ncbi:MAG: hypothetical protein IH784_01755, partial [Bacteroidetes bacterium]|nr:hypothetical protein [Bacteroidota bacterium]
MDNTEVKKIEELANQEYKYGFTTDIEAYSLPKGLSEDIIRQISEIKDEPEFMLEWRLKAYRHWLTMKEPHWPNVKYPEIDYQEIIYYSAPKKQQKLNSLDEVDPEILDTYKKLGISLDEQKRLTGVAVDAVFANLTFPNGTTNLLSLSNVVGDKYNASFAIPDLTGTYNVSFIANDTSGNLNNTETTSFDAIALPVPQPNMTVVKLDNLDPVENGTLLNYTINVTNIGPGNATNVT